jgi:hypothetical protein
MRKLHHGAQRHLHEMRFMRIDERMFVGDLRPHFIATAGKISRPFCLSSNIIAKVDRGLIATEKGTPRLKSESK